MSHQSTQLGKDGIPNLRVAAETNVESLAGAIAEHLKTYPIILVSSVGQASTYNVVKAIARARGIVGQSGKDLVCRPGFAQERLGPDQELTVMQFYLKTEI